MAQNDYTIVVDPSGQLLQDLDEIVYQNYDVSYMPVYGQTYKLTNYNQVTIANTFIPYASSASLNDVQDYMTFDASDTLYITDRNESKPSIQIFITTGVTTENGRFADIGYNFTTSQYPYGLAFDASGILYVTMNNSRDWASVTRSWILKINLTTLVGTEVDVPGITFGHLYGCAFDSLGNFYVSDYTNNKIIKITMVNYSTGTASIYANLYSGLNQPTDICFDISGNGYISNLGANNVIKISNTNTPSIFGSGLLNPYTLLYSDFDNILYVANLGDSTTNGEFVRIINGTTTQVPSKFNNPFNPYSLAIKSTGGIYVSEILPIDRTTFNGPVRITEMVPDNVVNNFSSASAVKLAITSVAFDTTQTFLYASSYNRNEILKYTNTDISGNTSVVFYNDSSTGPPLNGPVSIVFDTIGNLYLVENSSELIMINSSGVGAYVTITGYALNTPSSIQFDGTGRMYVANYNANTICILTFSTPTTATSTLFQPTGQQIFTPNSLAFNGTYTKLYVSCQANNKILEIDMSANVATQYNLAGEPLSAPGGIVYDSTTNILYISNQSTNEIYYITNYNYVAILNIIETTSNSLSDPLSIVLNTNSNLYIANNASVSCPIACITQNTTWASKYNPFVSYEQNTTNAVPDRDTKNTYAYTTSDLSPLASKIYRLDKNGILYLTPSFVASAAGARSMTLGQDLSGNKFLAILLSNNSPVQITFVPYTIATLPAGVFNPQSTTLDFDTSSNSIVFADISATQKSLFIASIGPSSQFIRVDVTNVSNPFASTPITINDLPANISVSYMAVYPVFQSGNYTQYLYIGQSNGYNIYRVDISGTTSITSTYTAELYLTFPGSCLGLTLDDNGYLYNFGQGVSDTSLYRALPDAPTTSSYIPLNPPNLQTEITQPESCVYCNWDQSLFIFSSGSTQMVKYYIGFPFTGMNSVNTIGPYDDTGYIFDITDGANTYDFNFNIYTPYVVIDPSNIPLNTRTEVSIHFVIPFNQPAPSDSYRLRCDGRDISDVFCNNCTYNKETFLAGTFPTGLVYSTDSQFLYVALDNDTISRINPFGIVENNFIPSSAGLKGPTSLVLDSDFNMFILNAGSDFISFLTLENNIISVDNSFFTGINTPICLTYDNISNDYLYLLSGIVPNMRLTKILATDASQNQIIGLPFGTLYNSNGLTICEFNPGFKFLYISDTDQNGINRIIQVSLSDGLYTPTTLITGLTYKPFTMANKNDGYLYIANKTSNNISKVSVQSVLIQPIQAVQPWVSNSISVPAGLCFDGSGNLYVANSGTTPRNSRISKIYIDYYFFTNVVISSSPCIAQIYDITTNSYVEVDYYTSPGDPTTFPIPIPYPINS